MRLLYEHFPAVSLWFIALLALGVYFFRWQRARALPRQLCPGPRPRWFHWLLPRHWLLRPLCGYNLSAAPVNTTGQLTCPECGRTHQGTSRLRQTTRRVRPATVCLALTALASLVTVVSLTAPTRWIELLPTEVLVQSEILLDADLPQEIKTHLWERIDARRLSPQQKTRLARACVAFIARPEFDARRSYAHVYLPHLGAAGDAALASMLQSPNWRSRGWAAAIRLHTLDPNAMPEEQLTSDLLEVAIEGLRLDRPLDLPPEEFKRMVDGPTQTALFFSLFRRFPTLTAPRAALHLTSDDPQQRLLCAAICAFAGDLTTIHTAAPILIEHLADNKVEGDANLAAAALASYGPAAGPYLRAVINSADFQQAETAAALVQQLDPPEGAALAPIATVQHITKTRSLNSAVTPQYWSGPLPKFPAPHVPRPPTAQPSPGQPAQPSPGQPAGQPAGQPFGQQ